MLSDSARIGSDTATIHQNIFKTKNTCTDFSKRERLAVAIVPLILWPRLCFTQGGGNSERMFDYLVVGAGFAGAVVAERMARHFSKKVLVVDKRPHVAGNAYDRRDSSGVLIHVYGPHIFHTNSAEVFNYLSQFTEWRPYEHRVRASVDGKLVPIPINLDTVNQLYGLKLTSDELEHYFASVAEARPSIQTSEDVVVSRVGRDLYEKLFRGYTRKQWGLDPSELDSSVIARIPVRTNRDDRYFTDTWQAMPLNGYTRMFENMLDHPNITLSTGTDYRDVWSTLSTIGNWSTPAPWTNSSIIATGNCPTGLSSFATKTWPNLFSSRQRW